MPRLLAVVEYLGSPFHGFQRQAGISTVQGELEAAVGRITGCPTAVSGAGRTDAGVHAAGQAVAFDVEDGLEPGALLAGLNAVLPRGLRVLSLRRVRDDFDPRRDALWREYRYFLLSRPAPGALLDDFTHHVRGAIDIELARLACGTMVGAHDFGAFRASGSPAGSTWREVLLCDTMRVRGDVILIRVRANAFLYRMARIMAGAVLEVASGRMSPGELEAHLEGGAVPCAAPLPAKGLFLWRVEYPDDTARGE